MLQGSEQWESPSGVRSIELVNASACLGKLLSDTGNHRAAVPLLTINGWGGSLKDQAGRFSSRVGASLVRSLGLEKYMLMDTLRDFEDVAVDVPRHELRKTS